MRALAQKPDGELTFTCVPPGAGPAIAVEPVVTPPPTAAASGVVNAANPTSHAPLAPGSIASLYGTNLSGASITIANLPAVIFYVSALQVNFQVPPMTITKPTQFPLQVTQGESFTTIPVMLTPYAPAIFTANGGGTGQASALIANTSTTADPSNPAKKGEFIMLYCTGLGNATTTTTALTLAGATIPTSYVGPAPGFIGLNQVNFQIPTTAPSGNAIAITLSAGGVISNTATIAIQ